MSGVGGTGYHYVPHPRVPNFEEYARLFKETRTARKWSQVRMAEELRCPQAAISKVEAAKMAPTASMLWLAIELRSGANLKGMTGLGPLGSPL
jgi:DNA-binding XRE family transcriptional regulator